jgi:protein subunit release factor B
VEMSPAAEGFGIKSATLEVDGDNAYGILAAEKGGWGWIDWAGLGRAGGVVGGSVRRR